MKTEARKGREELTVLVDDSTLGNPRESILNVIKEFKQQDIKLAYTDLYTQIKQKDNSKYYLIYSKSNQE